MCTYSRNRDANLIEGVENLCRLCLRDLVDPVHVFNKENHLCSFLSFRIMLSAGVQFSYEKNLPNAICKQCHEQVEGAYIFRKVCQSSYRKIKSHLQALKCKDSREPQNDTADLKAENNTAENFKAENNTEEGKLVLNFEKDEVAEIQDNFQVPVEICNEVFQLDKDEDEDTVGVTTINNDEDVDDIRPNLDIATFLSTILTELEVLRNYGDCLELTDYGGISLELEMNDDNLINLEIVEEDQETEESPVVEFKSVDENVPESDAEQNVVIQYVTRNHANKNLRLADEGEITALEEKHEENMTLVVDKEEEGDRVKVMCPECNKLFVSKGSLRRHQRLHSGERPHACKVCGRRFTQRAVLKRHRLTHLETRPFQCDSCEKSFSGLSRHMTTHDGRVYMCAACAKTFKDKSSLLRHLKTCKHQSERTQPARRGEANCLSGKPAPAHPKDASTERSYETQLSIGAMESNKYVATLCTFPADSRIAISFSVYKV
ncbi:hypothetical protein K1T71_005823 [Dendrolimus kikuchii]|uniref:Uncharacterized protein n=1 Tax=Dendrolimus kikuchii TaxID=765133 RepID=A0ACC1D544_9NEOP|nr:hypothetical protein K1T71_005823 [Dendrolimus kikuchii]